MLTATELNTLVDALRQRCEVLNGSGTFSRNRMDLFFDELRFNYSQGDNSFIFGKWLLDNNPQHDVRVVSSPMTAVAAAAILPDYMKYRNSVWVATGSHHLSARVVKALSSRACVYYPTAREHNQWYRVVDEHADLVGLHTIVDFRLMFYSTMIHDFNKDDDLMTILNWDRTRFNYWVHNNEMAQFHHEHGIPYNSPRAIEWIKEEMSRHG